MNLPRQMILAVVLTLTAACASQRTREIFIPAPSTIDSALNSASIEDYILSFPPFHFHEEPAEEFAARVRNARSLPENQGKSKDYLYCPGDGCWPTKEFTLKRSSKQLIVKVHASEGDAIHVVIMQRVPGGWVQQNSQ